MANKPLGTRLREALGLRVKANTDAIDNTSIARAGLVDLFEVDGTTLLDRNALNGFRTLATSRNERYRAYDRMVQDALVSSAIEMYADDATPSNRQGQVIWVESEDQNTAAFCNRLLDVLGINDDAWSHIYSLCMYGDVYLKLHYDSDSAVHKINQDGLILNKVKKGYIYSEYVEQVPNPADIFDIVYRGKTVGFAETPTPTEEAVDGANQYLYNNRYWIDTTDNLYDERSYVHIYLAAGTERVPETITLQIKNGKGEVNNETFRVKRGRSLLENVYSTYQDLSLMEDSLVMNRASRSAIIRFLQIEVGDMPKNRVNELLKRIKNMVEQKNLMDKNSDTYKSQAAPGPIDNVVYSTTRNGKGAINFQSLGGDIDVRSITDVDHYANKLAAGFRIPRQYLGLDSPDNGFSGGVSATKVDARYARSVQRVQNAYIAGITTLLNLYAIDRGFTDYVNNFSVKMVSPSTTEDAERDETLKTKLDITDAIMQLIGDAYTDDTKRDVFEYLLNQFMNDPELVDILRDASEDEVGQEEFNDAGDFGSTPISGDSSPDIDIDVTTPPSEITSPIESSSDENELTRTPPGSVTASDEEFGDYSGEVE